MKAYDLTNQRFGKLVALYKCNYKKGNKYPWHCICDCGNETDVPTQDLTAGKVVSCGCYRKEKASETGKKTIHALIDFQREKNNLVGQKFGKLTVLQPIYVNSQLKWLCQCECGNQSVVQAHDLKSGNTSSCGCLKSKGQNKIAQLLNQHNISFQIEKSFENCYYPETQGICRFDFYVNNEYLIEYDGIQHFKNIPFFSVTLEEQQKRDQFKNEWCLKNNIPLIRIPYTYLNTITIQDLVLSTSDFIIK